MLGKVTLPLAAMLESHSIDGTIMLRDSEVALTRWDLSNLAIGEIEIAYEADHLGNNSLTISVNGVNGSRIEACNIP